MATVTIGAVVYELPVLNLKAIKQIWPLVDGVQDDDNLVKLMDAASDILVVALQRSPNPLTREEIEERTLGPEIPGIQAAIENLLIDSGLMERKNPAPGEAQAAEAAASTETGTASSQNSSQPGVPAEIGTQ